MPRKDKNNAKRRGKQVKGKDEVKLKRHETWLEGKRIDLKRFAYDVFVYSARKFRVRKKNICAWTGNENDYVLANFVPSVSRLPITYQILKRFVLHQLFKEYHETNEMDSLKGICFSFQVILLYELSKECLRDNICAEVELSLGVGCEFIAFLDSVKSPLYVKELANHWFECYFHLRKKKLEKAGGLYQMYLRGDGLRDDENLDYFIPTYCLPYEDSAVNDQLILIFIGQSPEDYKEPPDIDSSSSSSDENEGSVSSNDEKSSENESSDKLNFSWTKSSEDYAMPEDSMKQHAGLSGKQKLNFSPDTNVGQGFGRQNLDSSGLDTPMNPCLGALQVGGLLRSSARKVPKTLSKTHFEVITQQPASRRKGTSDQCGRPNREDSLSSVEKGLGQLNLDTSAANQSNQENPIVSISNYLVPSESLPSVKPKEIPEKQSQSLPSVRPKEFSKKPRRKYKKNKPKELSSTSSEENE